LCIEQACPPRDAIFACTDDVAIEAAVGRMATEMVTPYPPGIPDILTGERPAEPVLAYLRSVVEAGMNRSVTADPQFRTVHISSSTDEVCGRVGGERVLLTGAEDDYRSCGTGE
jgi:lysine decarboxylase